MMRAGFRNGGGMLVAQEHVVWLIAALSPGAKRHDAFEVVRHVDVDPKSAVKLGQRFHEASADGQALAVVLAVTEAFSGHIVIRYRRIDGVESCVHAAAAADGRLDTVVFD